MTEKEALARLRDLFGELQQAYESQKINTAELIQLCVEEMENPSRARGDLIKIARDAVKLLKGE